MPLLSVVFLDIWKDAVRMPGRGLLGCTEKTLPKLDFAALENN